MTEEILTRQDLVSFKQDLINELKQIFSKEQPSQKEWLRTYEVRELLKLSPGTLQTLRKNGTLQFTKVGGIFYYDYYQIQSLLTKDKTSSSVPGK